jgi:hypothetical protein
MGGECVLDVYKILIQNLKGSYQLGDLKVRI